MRSWTTSSNKYNKEIKKNLAKIKLSILRTSTDLFLIPTEYHLLLYIFWLFNFSSYIYN